MASRHVRNLQLSPDMFCAEDGHRHPTPMQPTDAPHRERHLSLDDHVELKAMLSLEEFVLKLFPVYQD